MIKELAYHIIYTPCIFCNCYLNASSQHDSRGGNHFEPACQRKGNLHLEIFNHANCALYFVASVGLLLFWSVYHKNRSKSPG